LTVKAPTAAQPTDAAGIEAAGIHWWPLQFARELDDAILSLRANELEIGTWVFKTRGDPAQLLAAETALTQYADHWFVREVRNLLERTLARLDVSSRTLFAIIDEESCFSGLFMEFALAADRSYMLDLPDGDGPRIALSAINFGALREVNGLSRLATRFGDDGAALERLRPCIGQALDASAAAAAGLVTFTPDDLDWQDEIRLALEERASLSPDALTGMEASLRFGGRETMETRIFGRLSAWQNWIFIRPNAIGEAGALKVFGSGRRPKFDWKRI
jgi:benzoyl-CoA-dihydrodiol lyase